MTRGENETSRKGMQQNTSVPGRETLKSLPLPDRLRVEEDPKARSLFKLHEWVRSLFPVKKFLCGFKNLFDLKQRSKIDVHVSFANWFCSSQSRPTFLKIVSSLSSLNGFSNLCQTDNRMHRHQNTNMPRSRFNYKKSAAAATTYFHEVHKFQDSIKRAQEKHRFLKLVLKTVTSLWWRMPSTMCVLFWCSKNNAQKSTWVSFCFLAPASGPCLPLLVCSAANQGQLMEVMTVP